MSNPPDIILDLLYARWRAQTLYAGVKLNIFEVIRSEPIYFGEIARELGLDPSLLYRLLRALCSLGLLNEQRPEWFSITAVGEFLQNDHPQSLRDLVLLREGPEHTAVWKHLPEIVRDGRQNGFEREFGYSAFDYAAHEPNYAMTFDAGMTSHSRLQTSWVLEALRDYDFSPIAHLCDVGGGQVTCSVIFYSSIRISWVPSWKGQAPLKTRKIFGQISSMSMIDANTWLGICL